MGKKNNNRNNKNNNNTLVFTTSETGNAFFNDLRLDGGDEEEQTPKSQMVVRVGRDRKNRGGKEVSLIVGLDLADKELADLAKMLKSKCGVGGAAKDGEIIIQGNHVDKIVELLKKKGYSNTKRTGG